MPLSLVVHRKCREEHKVSAMKSSGAPLLQVVHRLCRVVHLIHAGRTLPVPCPLQLVSYKHR